MRALSLSLEVGIQICIRGLYPRAGVPTDGAAVYRWPLSRDPYAFAIVSGWGIRIVGRQTKTASTEWQAEIIYWSVMFFRFVAGRVA